MGLRVFMICCFAALALGELGAHPNAKTDAPASAGDAQAAHAEVPKPAAEAPRPAAAPTSAGSPNATVAPQPDAKKDEAKEAREQEKIAQEYRKEYAGQYLPKDFNDDQKKASMNTSNATSAQKAAQAKAQTKMAKDFQKMYAGEYLPKADNESGHASWGKAYEKNYASQYLPKGFLGQQDKAATDDVNATAAQKEAMKQSQAEMAQDFKRMYAGEYMPHKENDTQSWKKMYMSKYVDQYMPKESHAQAPASAPQKPATPEKPAPAASAAPEKPAAAEKPAMSEKPAAPEKPAPAASAAPEKPAAVEKPAASEKPAAPAKPTPASGKTPEASDLLVSVSPATSQLQPPLAAVTFLGALGAAAVVAVRSRWPRTEGEDTSGYYLQL